MRKPPLSPTTGRPIGDYGSAGDAIAFALDVLDTGPGGAVDFLRDWRAGYLKGWPEFFGWLDWKGR